MTAERESELMAIGQALAENADKDRQIDELTRVVESSQRAIRVLMDENADLRKQLAVALELIRNLKEAT